MNREIKFRAWSVEHNLMIVDFNCFNNPFHQGQISFSVCNYGTSQWSDYDLIPMQFTGLKDKAGKEIYEGDIVIRTGHLYEIIFSDGTFGVKPISALKPIDRITSMYHGHALYNYLEDLEIIGNRYENSELLEKAST